MVELGEVCEIQRGTSITRKCIINGIVPVIAGGRKPAYYHNTSNRKGETITISGSGAYAGYICYFNSPIFASDCFTVKSLNEQNMLTCFIFHLLKSKQNEIYKLQSGMGQPHVYPKDIRSFPIPLPPLEIQKQIVEEIDGYQKVINGANQVIRNWKPTFRIDPEWPINKLGELCFKITDGSHNPPKNDSNGKFKMLSSRNILNGEINSKNARLISSSDFERENKRTNIQAGDVLLTIVGTIGRTAIVKRSSGNFTVQRSVAVLKINPNKITSSFLYSIISCDQVQKELNSLSAGVAQKGIYLNSLNKIHVPLPPLDIQKQIVEEIESEKTIIDANKELIKIMQNKIDRKINEVWEVEDIKSCET